MDQSIYSLMLIATIILFVIIENTLGLKKALLSAVLMVGIWLGMTFWIFGEIDALTGLEVFFILLMAGLSWWKQQDIWFKMQPVIFGVVIGAIVLGSHAMGQPILVSMFVKYLPKLAPEMVAMTNDPGFMAILVSYNMWSGIFFLVHAALVYWAAKRLSSWGWAMVRIIGFYGLQSVAFFISAFSNMA